MSKEKTMNNMNENNNFRITGRKFKEKTWFDALLSDRFLEATLDIFLSYNPEFFDRDAKAKEVVRLNINGMPAIEIKYSMPNDKETYSAFFGEFCHYTPTKSGEFKPDLAFLNDKENKNVHLTRRFVAVLAFQNGENTINNLDFADSYEKYNRMQFDKMRKKEEKQKNRDELKKYLDSTKKVK